MKRCISNVLFVALLFGGAVVTLGTSKPAAAADDPVVQADRALVQALQKGDQAAAEKLLDKDFSWIDSRGIMWAEDEAFEAKLKPLIPDASVATITEHKYGKVVWIQENVDNKYVAHFWVLRPLGWRLLHTNEIAVDKSLAVKEVRPNFAVPCINPCQQIPYQPLTANEKAALDGWLDQEAGNGNHDAHLGENLRSVHSENGVQPPKSERMAQTAKAMADPAIRNRPPVGVAPVLWMRSWDFGDAVVSIMLQPTYGGKAYWSSRLFGNHNGFWMMEESYHNTIQAAPPMTALPGGKGALGSSVPTE